MEYEPFLLCEGRCQPRVTRHRLVERVPQLEPGGRVAGYKLWHACVECGAPRVYGSEQAVTERAHASV